MTRMTGPDCVVVCNLINTHTHICIHTHIHKRGRGWERRRERERDRRGRRRSEEAHKNCRRDQALSFRMRHHLGRQGVALAGTRQLRSQGLVPVHAHRTEGVTGSEGREGPNGVGVEAEAETEMGTGSGVGTGMEKGREGERGGGERRSARWERGRGGNGDGDEGGGP